MNELFPSLPKNDKESSRDREERKRFEYESNKFYGLLEKLNRTLNDKSEKNKG